MAAGVPKFKEAVAKYVEYLRTQLYKSKVTVRLNKTATAEEILRQNPDAVIIAGGAKPIIPQIPGMEKMRVLEATQMLLQGDCPGEKIVVLGGDLVGCEAALHLENLGKEVTIVEKLEDILLTVKHATNNDLALRHLLSTSNITIHTNSLLSSIDTGKVIIEKAGQKIELPCDTLIVAIGYQADKSLAENLKGKIKRVLVIGDNVRPAKVIDAVHEGFHTARLLEELTT